MRRLFMPMAACLILVSCANKYEDFSKDGSNEKFNSLAKEALKNSCSGAQVSQFIEEVQLVCESGHPGECLANKFKLKRDFPEMQCNLIDMDKQSILFIDSEQLSIEAANIYLSKIEEFRTEKLEYILLLAKNRIADAQESIGDTNRDQSLGTCEGNTNDDYIELNSELIEIQSRSLIDIEGSNITDLVEDTFELYARKLTNNCGSIEDNISLENSEKLYLRAVSFEADYYLIMKEVKAAPKKDSNIENNNIRI
ncbi:MAG: hypothetical protein AB8E15_11230 [Bdellovibrionales bacterium]